jgi:hypothetical protein
MSRDKRTYQTIQNLVQLAATQERIGGSRLAAVLVYKNKSFLGFNSYKTHPFQAKHGRRAESICLHAEINAINKARKNLTAQQMQKATLYIARARGHAIGVDPSNIQWGLAKPCGDRRCGCQSVIHMFEIPRVVFTTNTTGEYEEWFTN